MPKNAKSSKPSGRSQDYLKMLMNLAILHSPCVSENCTVQFKHCSGCNESFPCKSRQILDGRTVAQINRKIDETITLYGDQADLLIPEEPDANS